MSVIYFKTYKMKEFEEKVFSKFVNDR